MARESPSQFVPSWYSTLEAGRGISDRNHHIMAYVRLWRAFTRARVLVALALVALQTFLLLTLPDDRQKWLLGLGLTYLALSLVSLSWPQPKAHDRPVRFQWLFTVGVDLLAFALLEHFQQASINFAPLFALPVLMAAILGSVTLALAAAAAATLYMLVDAATGVSLLADASTPKLLQSALAGTGLFVVALLANQMAQRLAREEARAKSSQAAARTQVQINELIIESLSEGVLVVDRHGVVRNANPAAQGMLMGDRYPQSAKLLLSARPGWEGLAQLVERAFLINQPLEHEVKVDVDELTTHRLFVRTRLTAALDGSKAELCVLFLEDLREVEARVRTEKLASMGRMSAAVAHEIRNPLSAITQANALLDEEVTSPTQKRLTRMIEQNSHRLSRIVDDILNVARAQPHLNDNVPVVALDLTLRQIAHEWIKQNHAKGVLGVHPHAPGAHIAFDPEHLRRLLVNLLDNALRHASRKPSSVRVITQPSGSDNVRISVWSDGPPIESSVLKHLFEPFFSSESRSSGLGLFICRELCERYGAQIAYQRSRLDLQEGNEFYVLAPRLKGSHQMPIQESLSYPPGESIPALTRPGAPSTKGPPPLSTL